MRSRVLVWTAIVALTLVVRGGHAANVKGGAAAGGPIQPASERILVGARSAPLRTQAVRGREADRATAAGRPAIRGPKIPDSLRAQLKGRLDARVSADVVRLKELRGEAIGLLRQFVAETPRGAREMPEALVRLGELDGENEREAFVDRFKAWERKAVDQRGPVPELAYRTARELFGRILRDYHWFEQYDFALYIDGFLAFEQNKEDEARERFERILRDYPESRFVADAHMARAETIFNGSFDYATALAEYERGLAYKGRIDPSLYGLALFKTAWCYWRRGQNEEAPRAAVWSF